MNASLLKTDSDSYNIGEIVWARHDQDGMYWPGRITFSSNQVTDTNLQVKLWSYFVQFFGYNQTIWTVDVLSYRQYRDYMSKHLLAHYDSSPQLKYQFLNAINYADVNENSIPVSNSIVTTSQISNLYPTNEYSPNTFPLYGSAPPHNTHISSNNSCSCCTQLPLISTNQLSVDTDLNPLLQSNNDSYSFQNHPADTVPKLNSITIITTKTYSNPPFISFIFNSLSTFFHTSLIYVEHLPNYQHPSVTSLTYLICFDQFDASLQHTLDATILNNLSAHVNYHFLLVNAPCQSLVKHLYTRIMDQRSILVVDYRSTFDDDALLLCSGNRETYEMLRPTLLKYLCSKVKYIESRDVEEGHTNTMNNVKHEPMVETSNKSFESQLVGSYQNAAQERLLTTTTQTIMKHEKALNEGKILKRKRHKHSSKHRRLSATPANYYVQNILDD
ncbi:unnamed protein product [Adineta ricciae]|uniref:PWWP domain-containing protein n=1 Tax=Adineta ricciae TaxID=249248 RepID=A0A815WEZ4_ADIRI|nr:unnamed protein product [Adineta ricciae]